MTTVGDLARATVARRVGTRSKLPADRGVRVPADERAPTFRQITSYQQAICLTDAPHARHQTTFRQITSDEPSVCLIVKPRDPLADVGERNELEGGSPGETSPSPPPSRRARTAGCRPVR